MRSQSLGLTNAKECLASSAEKVNNCLCVARGHITLLDYLLANECSLTYNGPNPCQGNKSRSFHFFKICKSGSLIFVGCIVDYQLPMNLTILYAQLVS